MGINLYDQDLQPGDRLTFTPEVELHLDSLGIEHHFDYGDELIVLADEWQRKFPILVGDRKDPGWQARIFRGIAERARDFWLRSCELELEGEGVTSPLPLDVWNAEFCALSPKERSRVWKLLQEGDVEQMWRLMIQPYRRPVE
ncbi:MAG: hypothetical protein IPK19_20355 [Chloroflexi bacterium]|nr:hypothetical protein [Chloroflexota bacterium]